VPWWHVDDESFAGLPEPLSQTLRAMLEHGVLRAIKVGQTASTNLMNLSCCDSLAFIDSKVSNSNNTCRISCSVKLGSTFNRSVRATALVWFVVILFLYKEVVQQRGLAFFRFCHAKLYV
jgi:hypothetical protein